MSMIWSWPTCKPRSVRRRDNKQRGPQRPEDRLDDTHMFREFVLLYNCFAAFHLALVEAHNLSSSQVSPPYEHFNPHIRLSRHFFCTDFASWSSFFKKMIFISRDQQLRHVESFLLDPEHECIQYHTSQAFFSLHSLQQTFPVL
jgi:hypothetical protein